MFRQIQTSQVQFLSGNMPRVCFFSLATSGFNNPEIIEIAAVFWDGYTFNRYIFPQQPIHPEATEINGFSTDAGRLFWFDTEVTTDSREDSLRQFIDFLKDSNSRVILAAHKAYFHACLIVKDLLRCGLLEEFCSVVLGFTDTVEIMKNKFPERRQSFKLTSLARDFLDIDTHNLAHDALDNAIILKDLVWTVNFRENNFSRMIHYFIDDIKSSIKTDENRKTLNFLRNSVSTYTIKKLANAGINWEILKETYLRKNRGRGIENLLTGRNPNHPMVTRDPDIIAAIVEQLASLIDRNPNSRYQEG